MWSRMSVGFSMLRAALHASQRRSHVVHAHIALTASLRTCSSAADLVPFSQRIGDWEVHCLHSVPSTSNTMPFNVGLFSPSFLLTESRGAKRRGRIGCAMELSMYTPFEYRVKDLGLITEAEVRSLRLFEGRKRMPIIVVAAVEGTPAVFASSHHRHWLVWPTVAGALWSLAS